MASQTGNSAQAVDADLASGAEVREPSMDEILASIKQIIADDENDVPQVTRREDYSVPVDAVNSNSVDEIDPAFSESAMAAALEAELLGDPTPEVTPPVATPVPSPIAPQFVAQPTTDTLEERAARVRAEVTAAGIHGSADARLEAYRVRSRLQTETLAVETARRAEERAEKQAAFERQKEETARKAFESVAAGPVLPSTHAVAEQMAATMMREKGDEMQAMVADLMRPTIRQWLSDNLPSLVEKLVREEIEAVSRGRKR